MKLRLLFIMLISLLLTGCFLDPYTNGKYGEQVIDAWFNYKKEDDDLGKVRRSVENIYEIDSVDCKYLKKYKQNYIFKCNLSYKENSDTIIPFSEPKTMNLYTVFTPYGETEFTYKVYNSSSKEGIWEEDTQLK